MVSEYDLPCTACGENLERATVTLSGVEARVAIAECDRCGARHYPRSALDALKSRTRT